MTAMLTDDAVSRLPLQAGRAELLEEIMSTVAPERQQAEPVPPRRRARLVPLAAAAVVAGIAGGSLWWQQSTGTTPAGAPGGSDPTGQAATRIDIPGQGGIVLDAPGWKVSGLGEDGLRFAKGSAELEITSYDADLYATYVRDRKHIGVQPEAGEPITVLGRPALMWAYSADDHTAIREVEDGHWLEFRASGLREAAYLDLLGRLRLTSQAEFEASLPEGYARPGQRQAVADQILSEIEAVSGAGFPQGDAPSFAEGEAKDAYQFGAEVVGAYTCAWLDAYENATAHAQPAQADEALRVLGTAHDWPVLARMDKDGDYPEVIWQIADEAGRGELRDWYGEGLGC